MMERSQFTFYESFFRAISRIKDNGDRAATYDAICAYALYGTMPDLDALPDASAIAFELIKPNLDASRKKAASGRMGGSAKQSGSKSEAKSKQSGSKSEASDEDTQSKKEEEGENEKEGEKEIEGEDECLIGSSIPTNPVIGSVISYYLNRINPMASPTCLEELTLYAEGLGEDVCKKAIDIALDNKATTWPYIRAILQDKQANGVKCLADWDALEEERKKTTSKKGGAKHGGSEVNSVPSQRIGNYV